MAGIPRRTASRRTVIKTGISALAGVALVSFTGAKALAADVELAKSAVQYEDVAKDSGKDCDDCIHFIPGKTANAAGTCKVVEGEINPHGHCLAFAVKPAK